MATEKIPIPGPIECTGDVYQNWTYFKEQWENYEIATGLDERTEKVRLSTFKAVIGKDCYNILKHLDIAEEDREKIDSIIGALEAHFKPRKNIVYERYLFNTCNQQPNEQVDQYVNKLRQLAASCEFEALRDELIRDRLVLGCKDSAARARMFREPNLDLNRAIAMCRSSEIAQDQLQKIGATGTTEESVHYSKNNGKKYHSSQARRGGKMKMTSNTSKCRYCGGQHKFGREECPAYGETCGICQMKNHYARMCLQKKAAKKKSINLATEYDDTENDDSDSDTSFKLETVGKVNTKGRKYFVHLQMGYDMDPHKNVKCQMDTGTTGNLISFTDACKVAQDGSGEFLQKTSTKLKFYDGTIIQARGNCRFNCKYKGKIYPLEFKVVDTDQKPLLSGETCEELGLIQIEADSINQVTDANTEYSKQSANSDIFKKYKNNFEGLGCLKGEYQIEIDPSIRPVQHQPRRVPLPLKQELKKKLGELEKQGIIAKVNGSTPWINSLVAVKKPGKLRICIDPKDLNKAILRPKYPMPVIEDILPNLTKAKVFSVLDAKDGFHQVKLSEESSYLTTFWTPFGRYRYLRMPFGISSGPEEYQRRQHEVIEGLPGVDVIADDILVYGSGETLEEANLDHDRNLEKLMERAQEKNLKFNKKKARLRMSEVPYMGHLLTTEGVKPDPKKVSAVAEMPAPTDKKGVQRLLGFVNYLAKFLPHLSDTCEPLRRLTDQNAEWRWDQQHKEAFEKIKQLVTAQPVLKYYDINEEVTIQCDASDKGLGAALLQNGQPVAFASRALSQTEQRYAQIEKECLAIVFACERFDHYIHGRELVNVESDHKPLEAIFQKPILSAPKRLQRMMLRLQKYSLHIKYKQGSKMYIADALSRAYLPTTEVTDDKKQFEIFAIRQEKALIQELEEIKQTDFIRVKEERLHQIQKSTLADSTLQALQSVILTGWPDSRDEVPICVRSYFGYRDELTVQDGILYKGMKVIIPKAMRREMINRTHSSHQGIEASIRKAKDVLFWPGMNGEIQEAVERCETCNEFAIKQQKEPLMTHEIPTYPWKKVGMDVFTLEKKDYLVTCDYYSDFWELDKLRSTTSKAIIACCRKNFARNGIPQEIVSDNGPQFTSEEFTQFAEKYEFKHTTSSPYHSQSNGKAESTVKIAKRLMKKAKRDRKDYWLAILDYRNTPTEGADSSPVQRLMSRRTRTLLPTSENLLLPNHRRCHLHN